MNQELKTVLSGSGITIGSMLILSIVVNSLEVESFSVMIALVGIGSFIGVLGGTAYVMTKVMRDK